MRVTIEAATCLSNGLCEDLADAIFEVDEDGVGRVRRPDVPDELRRAVADAVKLCPSQSITITGD